MYAAGGRTVRVQPLTQIVEPIVAWVTSGLSTPGVRTGSEHGAGGRPSAMLDPKHERDEHEREARDREAA